MQLQIPLPPKIDSSVTMMQVEEKPDITYDNVGGCKDQIEKLREVVELPLLDVSILPRCLFAKTMFGIWHTYHFPLISLDAIQVLVSILQRAF